MRFGSCVAAILVATSAVGCGDETGDSGSGGGHNAGPNRAPVTSGMNVTLPGGELSQMIAPGGALSFQAYAGDPNGIDDIVQAFLASEDGQLVYGELERGGAGAGMQDGATLYEFRLDALTYEQMDAVLPFVFDQDGKHTRVVRAVFVDRAGAEAAEMESVYAEGEPGCATKVCGGVCVDTLSDVNNCGNCGVKCTYPSDDCDQGICKGPSGWSTCVTPSATSHCEAHCASINRACSPACGVLMGGTQLDGIAVHEYLNAVCTTSSGADALHDTISACTTPFSQFAGAESFKCCCE